ncbi:MAG: hypothetical protein ACRDBO_09655 [Lachnospiraceae bacterium]
MANVNLIVSMEADKDRADSSSVYTPLNVSYVSIVNENRQKRRPKVLIENMLDDPQSYSQIDDHGSYYEVTHGCIIAEISYDLSVMNGNRVSDLNAHGLIENPYPVVKQYAASIADAIPN